MAIAVMILHVVSLFTESGERVWIVCNYYYSMNTLLNFILVAFVNHQCIKKIVTKDIFHDWKPRAALVSHCVMAATLYFNACHAILTESLPV